MLKVTQLYGFGGGSSRGPLVFESASSYNGSSASSHSVTMPATFLAGDLLLAHFRASQTISSVTGWTEITTGGTTGKVFYKVAAGSDTATVVLGSSGTLEASIAAYGPTSGVEGTPTGDVGTIGASAVMTAITVTTAGGLLIATGSLPGGGTITTPSGFTQDATATPSGVLFKFYSKAIAATGSTGSVTLAQSASNTIIGGIIYIKA